MGASKEFNRPSPRALTAGDWQQAAAYDFGKSRKALVAIEKAVQEASGDAAAQAELLGMRERLETASALCGVKDSSLTAAEKGYRKAVAAEQAAIAERNDVVPLFARALRSAAALTPLENRARVRVGDRR